MFLKFHIVFLQFLYSLLLFVCFIPIMSILFHSDEEESNWTEEEEDKLVMWYNELEGQSDMVEKLSVKFCDQGINKSKLEVSYYKIFMLYLRNRSALAVNC